MGGRKKKYYKDQRNKLQILWIFIACVIVLVCTSLFLKLISVAVQSSFDGKHRFTIAVDGKPLQVISFSPEQGSISSLTISTSETIPLEKIGQHIRIPVDAIVTISADDTSFSSGNVQEKISYLFFHYPSIKTNMTILDTLRLWWYTRSIKQPGIFQKTITISEKSKDHIDELLRDKVAAQLFTDNTISEENSSIHIINATGVQGIGNRMAQLISNIGGNVVLVTTADNLQKVSEIQHQGDSTYTVKKFAKVFKMKEKAVDKTRLADIIIVIGTDSISYGFF